MTIESEFGKGTSVEICLPRYKGDVVAAPVEESSGEHRAGANEVVLIVEDQAVVRLLIAEALNDLGYHALETADSAAALPILQSSQRIDLLVSDIGLPGLKWSPACGCRARHPSRSEGPIRYGIRRERRKQLVLGARYGDYHQALHDRCTCQQNPRDDRGRPRREIG